MADAAAETCKCSDVVCHRGGAQESMHGGHMLFATSCKFPLAQVASRSVTARKQDISLLAIYVCSYAEGQKPAAPDSHTCSSGLRLTWFAALVLLWLSLDELTSWFEPARQSASSNSLSAYDADITSDNR